MIRLALSREGQFSLWSRREGQVLLPREDVLVDCLALTVGADSRVALVTLEVIRLVRVKLGVNMTLGASNVSFGLPDRDVLNQAFLAMAIREGVNAPIVNAARVRQAILAMDVFLGRDEFAMRYIKHYRKKRTCRQALRAANSRWSRPRYVRANRRPHALSGYLAAKALWRIAGNRIPRPEASTALERGPVRST